MLDLTIIRELCSNKGITIYDLAKAIGITSQGIQRIIGENKTKLETLEKIANHLGVPITFFFRDKSGGRIYITKNDYDDIKVKIEEAGLQKYEKEILSALAFLSRDNGVTKDRFIKDIIMYYENIELHQSQIEELKKSINLYQRVIEQNEVIIDHLLKENKPKK